VVSWIWAASVGATPIVAALCRNRGLCRHAGRKASIEGTVRDRSAAIPVVDPTAAGELLYLEVLGTPELDLRCPGA
jgi:hypothetical protein